LINSICNLEDLPSDVFLATFPNVWLDNMSIFKASEHVQSFYRQMNYASQSCFFILFLVFITPAWFFFLGETGMILIVGCFNVSMYKSIQKHFSFLVHVKNLNYVSPAWFLFLNIIIISISINKMYYVSTTKK